MEKTYKIYSIIVTYNGMQRNWIQKCLDSLLVSSVQAKIIIIDNGSTDGTIDFIQENYLQVDLILANENLGFAKANNIGIKKAYERGAEYVFLLNQDAWVEKNTLEELLKVFEQKTDAGIVSPIHLNGDKTNLDYGFVDYIVESMTPNLISDLYFNRLKQYYETQFINAAAWLVSRKCIERVGGFDTSIFYHYGEDTNYCQRVIYHGFKIYIDTTTTICHDRWKRAGQMLVEQEKEGEELWKRMYYANILENDTIIKDAIYNLKWKSLMQGLIKIAKLQFKGFFIQRRVFHKELNLYLRIKKNRAKYKQGGLVWLNEE